MHDCLLQEGEALNSWVWLWKDTNTSEMLLCSSTHSAFQWSHRGWGRWRPAQWQSGAPLSPAAWKRSPEGHLAFAHGHALLRITLRREREDTAQSFLWAVCISMFPSHRVLPNLSSPHHWWLPASWSPSCWGWTELRERLAPSNWEGPARTPGAVAPSPPAVGTGWWGSGQALQDRKQIPLGWRLNGEGEGLELNVYYNVNMTQEASRDVIYILDEQVVGCGTRE